MSHLGHLGKHVQRHGISYAALAVAFSFSPLPGMAADLVTTGDIANGAVTTAKLANGGVKTAKIADGAVTGAKVQDASIGPADVANLVWHNLVLTNDWVNYNGGSLRPPAWALDAEGVIHLRGAVAEGASGVFAHLPASVRPATTVYVATDLCEANAGRIDVSSDGEVEVEAAGPFEAAQCFTSLDGVTWPK